jgi:4-diphosphocytidyl-2-C-methyl-D-erythritol kinase
LSTLRLRAHAKLNLALHVGARREDGYHPIAGVFQTISLCDLLYATCAGTAGRDLLRLQVVGAELPADNTVRAAVEKLAREARRSGAEPLPLRMRLIKRVPMGAGLGGGSSDAATALGACASLWKLDRAALSETGALERIAAEVGSDVPFFLHGGTAMVTGRGEEVAGLEPLVPTWFVVAAPRLHVSTPAAYAAFDSLSKGSSAGGGVDLVAPRYTPNLDAGWVHNDLQAPVSDRHPEVAAARRRLLELGARCAQMTGSGAASFGSFADRRSATKAARVLRREGFWGGAFVSVGGEAHRRSALGDDAREGV